MRMVETLQHFNLAVNLLKVGGIQLGLVNDLDGHLAIIKLHFAQR